MIFINTQGVIVKISPNTTPLSLDILSSDQPVLGVLELNAGAAKKLNITVGDKILYPAFQQ